MNSPREGWKWRPTWGPVVALLVVTVIWGGTFVWMKDAMGAIARVLGPGTDVLGMALFTGLRFGVAAIVIRAASKRARGALGRPAWRSGTWLGGLLFAGFSLQMLGLAEVSPAVSAFLTSPYVLFTAFLTAALDRKPVHWPMTIGALLATIGAAVIRGRPELSFHRGETLTLICAAVFAIHIVGTDRVTKRLDPIAITYTSFCTVAAASAVLFTFLAAQSGAPGLDALAALLSERDFLVPLALTTVFATVIALSLMNLYQRDLGPVRAAILYALEPIWATLFGLYMGLDTFTAWLWIGGSILLAGNLVAEISARRDAR